SAKCQPREAAISTACSYAACGTTPGAGLSKTMRSLRSSSRVNSRTFSDMDLAVAFQSTWLADAVEVVPAAAHEGLELPGDHGQDLEHLVGRLDRGIHDDLAGERDPPRLHQEREREAGGDAEALLLVAAAAVETQLHVGGGGASGGNVREVDGGAEDGRRGSGLAPGPQLQVRHADPFPAGFSVKRKADARALPPPALARRLPPGWNYADGKRRRMPAAIVQRQAGQGGRAREDVRRNGDVQLQPAQHARRGDT